MNFTVFMLTIGIAFSGLALSTENAGNAFTDQAKASLADPQNDLDCKMYGLASAMLSEFRDHQMPKDAAIAEVTRQFKSTGTPTQLDRNALTFVLASIRPVADDVYQNGGLHPDTALQAYPFLCLSETIFAVKPEPKKEYFSAVHVCQENNLTDGSGNPAPRNDPAIARLKECITRAGRDFMHKLNEKNPGQSPKRDEASGGTADQPKNIDQGSGGK